MRKDKKQPKTAIIILAILLVASLLANLYFYIPKQKCPECPQPKEKALLAVEIYTWGYNMYDPSELLFDYWIMNYGNAEARDIKIRCKLVDKYNNVAFSGREYFGNLASNSVEFGEFTPKKSSSYDPNTEYSGFCYVESCSNCEILYKNIPELIKSYEV